MGIPAAALSSGHTLLLTEHVARLTNAALLAGGGDFGVITLAFQVPAGG